MRGGRDRADPPRQQGSANFPDKEEVDKARHHRGQPLGSVRWSTVRQDRRMKRAEPRAIVAVVHVAGKCGRTEGARAYSHAPAAGGSRRRSSSTAHRSGVAGARVGCHARRSQPLGRLDRRDAAKEVFERILWGEPPAWPPVGRIVGVLHAEKTTRGGEACGSVEATRQSAGAREVGKTFNQRERGRRVSRW